MQLAFAVPVMMQWSVRNNYCEGVVMGEALLQMYETMSLSEQQEVYDFAKFILSKKEKNKPTVPRKSYFGALKDKISYIAPDFDAPLEDFANYQ